MLIGAMSDTHLHTPGPGLQKLLSGPLGEADILLHAGDHDGAAVAEYLLNVEERTCHAVAGNADPLALKNSLGMTKLIEIEGLKIGLVHGWGAPDGLLHRVKGVFGGEADIIVYGHSHVPLIKREGGTLIINPGSPFFPRSGGNGTIALIKIENGGALAEIVEVAG